MIEVEVSFARRVRNAVLASIGEVMTPRTRIAIIDRITSPSALVLPIGEIVEMCHAAGIPVLVDGAQGPSQIPLDLQVIGAVWYVGNCQKWLCAPKGCGGRESESVSLQGRVSSEPCGCRSRPFGGSWAPTL
jgi:isopenicillin-N epimerase